MTALTLHKVLVRGLTTGVINGWIAAGYLHPIGHGHGHRREWPQTELQVADLMRRLIDAGFTHQAAHKIARDQLEGHAVVKLGGGLALAINTDLLCEVPA